ncbi:rRNA methyltransferase [Deltaproteobacteria bacterium]|nr:rRNA methyltransferase [Deltaproteobacteria bacterium]
MLPITVILVRPRFPENIGMAARACANMGVSDLILIKPERWDYDKALPLATGRGREVLDHLRVLPSLRSALGPQVFAFGTSARTGGHRQAVLSPREAAQKITAHCRKEENLTAVNPVALVFGPEDKGLENEDIMLCSDIVTIPTEPGASSLNLAQAVLLFLYECFTASLGHAYHKENAPHDKSASRAATLEEAELLFSTMQETLQQIRFLPDNNPEWFMQSLKRFFRRSSLRRHEFDLFMGIFRRIRNSGKALP